MPTWGVIAMMLYRRVSCEGKGDGKPSTPEEQSTSEKGSKKTSKSPGSRGPLRRFIKSLSGATIFGQKMYRVVGNVVLLMLLGHLLPFGGKGPLTGELQTISVEVHSAPLSQRSSGHCTGGSLGTFSAALVRAGPQLSLDVHHPPGYLLCLSTNLSLRVQL